MRKILGGSTFSSKPIGRNGLSRNNWRIWFWSCHEPVWPGGAAQHRPNPWKMCLTCQKKYIWKGLFLSDSQSMGKTFTVQKQDGLSYKEGDMVRHIKFGIGKVQEIEEGKKDYEVTVDFQKVG